jgi:aryl-alcohol dehydrogenase-like predicted oxidoreductase/histidinol phosphatase-like enzyme
MTAPFNLSVRLGLGCQRLSGPDAPPEEDAVRLILAALDAGVRFLDTADVYAPRPEDIGHNERLIAKALARWSGEASRVVVATKGGLTRTGERWLPDGRAKQLRQACEASRRALGLERIPLYQLHAPDPHVPFTTSLRALARLQEEGKIERVGLCNVRVSEIEAARGIVEVASVQVALSPFESASLRGGVVGCCARHGIALIAYRPLGGQKARLRFDDYPALQAVAARHGATDREVVLAWLLGLSPLVLPLPGATRLASLSSSVRAAALTLTEEDIAELDAAFPAVRALRRPRSGRAPDPRTAGGEVVLLMGLPGAGKSTAAEQWVARGHLRLNRDQRGGRLSDLLPLLDQELAKGNRRLVLDNTYPRRDSRNAVIETAWKHGVPVRCVWLQTSLEDAQVNAVRRMIQRYGRLLGPEEMRQAARRDPNAFYPEVQFRYRRELEEPSADEGFAAIEPVAFVRRLGPEYSGRAVLFEYDGRIRKTRSGRPYPLSPEDIELLPRRREVLADFAARGYRLLGVSQQPGIARRELSEAELAACFERTHELLGLTIEVVYCPHPPGPPLCWCQRPLPGLGVWWVEKYLLEPARCQLIGMSPAERGFAARNGFRYVEVSEVFR